MNTPFLGYDPVVVDGYRQIADAVHRHGALALAQLTHSGMQGQQPLFAIAAVGAVAGAGGE
jgi:2,4-dienoyl-CoA reductase-like NADH-dependent reductase (Old Yellow Enzyme family)